MRSIPFNAALELLAAATVIEVADVPCTVLFSNVYTEADADYFLEIEADDGDGRLYKWAFARKANYEVKVDGTTMTLVADSDDYNDVGPLEVRLLSPLDLEAPDPAAAEAGLKDVAARLTRISVFAGTLRGRYDEPHWICRPLFHLVRGFDSRGNAIPPE